MNDLQYLSSLKVLLLEDDPILLENYTITFQGFFSSVIPTQDTQKAYEKTKELTPDLIVADIHIKNDTMDGLDFIKKLRDEQNFTPVLIFSALTEAEFFLKAIPLKLVDYLVKPVNYNDIILALKSYIKETKCSSNIVLNEEMNITFNQLTLELKKNNEIQKIPLNARKLLALLMKSKDKFVTYEMIEYEIYFNKDFYLSTVRNHISMLRAILGKESIVVNVEYGYQIQL